MNVSLQFPAEVESALLRRAAAAGQDVETFLRTVVTESLALEPEPAQSGRSLDEFVARLRAISGRHPGSGGRLDDSRESIYAGCGE